MKKRLVILCASALLGATAMGAPTVTTVYGTAQDDQRVTISGNGFGTAGTPALWLGGRSGVVDSAADGTRIDQLGLSVVSLLTPSTSTYPHVSSERGWSNGKAAAFDVRNTTEYKQTLFVDLGSSGYSGLYTNSLIFFDHDQLAAGSYLQWKMMRWTRTATVVDGDGAYMANRPNQTSFFSNFSSAGQSTYWFNSAGTSNLPGRGAWYRYETWLQMNSAPGVADGKFRVKVTSPTTGSVVVDNRFTNIVFNGSGDSGNLRYLVLQNYFGNAQDSGANQPANANAVAWWDDIYVAKTEARVELCSSPTWSQCVNREIQPAVSWADNQVIVNLNKSAISDLNNAYLYVVNSLGEVNSQGYRIASPSVVPAAPTGAQAR